MTSEVIRVLIIDDDPQDARLAGLALRSAGSPTYEYETAESIPDAMDAIAEGHFDITLIDLGLSRTQGVETLEAFRRQNKRLPVIVLTGLEDDSVATMALQRGAQDYLFKNEVNATTLSRAIRYAIQRQASVQEIRRLYARVRENEIVLQKKNDRLRTLYETAHAFVDNVSHEFRTPLTVIKEYVAMVRDGTMGEIGDEQADFLRIAEDRADDLNTMVDDMLDVSKLEAGLLSVCRKSHTINEIADRVVPALTRKAAVKDLELSLDLNRDLPRVYCDAEKIGRVLINLTVNAMKFTQPGGKISIWARENGNDIVVGVMDTGAGIAPEGMDLIFERFQQANVQTPSSTKGFGLGLNIAKELVHLNLGAINVESEIGEGSTFSFSIPIDNSVQVTNRYLAQLSDSEHDSVAMAIASIAAIDASDEACDDVGVFLDYAIRSTDLSFRVDDRRWVILLPGNRGETLQFIDRTARELRNVNRNRPRGPLPSIEWEIEEVWSGIRESREEITARLNTHVVSGSMAWRNREREVCKAV